MNRESAATPCGDWTGDGHDYRERANLNRPRDTDTLRAAVHELRARGLTARDVAQALGLAETAIATLLGERTP